MTNQWPVRLAATLSILAVTLAALSPSADGGSSGVASGSDAFGPTAAPLSASPLSPASDTLSPRPFLESAGTETLDDPPPPPPDLGASLGYFHSLAPARVLDTRDDGGALGQDASRTVQLAGVAGVPASGVSAVALNVTAVNPTNQTFVTVYPSGEDRPLASNLNVAPGQVRPNMVVAKLGPDGAVDVYNRWGSVHLVFDVVGFFAPWDQVLAGGEFTGIAPTRVLDTRDGTGGVTGALGQGQTIEVDPLDVGLAPMLNAQAVAINVTAVSPSAQTFLTIWPSGAERPLASSLNAATSEVAPNLVLTKIGADGRIHVFNRWGSVHVVIDLVGWYTAPFGGQPSSAAQPAAASVDAQMAVPAHPDANVLSGEDRGSPVIVDEVDPAFWNPERIREAEENAGVLDLGDAHGTNGEEDPQLLPAYTGVEPPYPVYRHAIAGSPFRAVGRLYYVQGGRLGVCTASVVWSRTILTAGHCVAGSTNILFVPRKYGASEPLGRWSITGGRYLSASPGPRDYALLWVATRNGVTIAQAVGGYEPTFFHQQGRWAISVGYPAEGYAAQDGRSEFPRYCWSYIYRYNQFSDGWVQGQGCPMTGGASGGPIYVYRAAEGQYRISSVNSGVAPVRCWPSSTSVTHGRCPAANPWSERGIWHSWNLWGPWFDSQYRDFFAAWAQ